MEGHARNKITDIPQLLDVLHEGFLILDENGKIVDVNRSYCEMLGYSKNELIGDSIFHLRPGLEIKDFQKYAKRLVIDGVMKFDIRHRTKGGGLVDLKISALGFEKEGTRYLLEFVKDVTSRKEAERKLRETENRWQRLVEKNPLPIIITVDGIIEFANQNAIELYGADNESELIGKNVFSFIHPDSKEEIKRRQEKFRKGEPLEPSVQKFIGKEGTHRIVEVHTAPITYKGKKAAQTVIKDITEARRREQRVEESRQLFKSLFAQNPNAVYSFDLEGNFIMANDQLEFLLGYSMAELKEMDFGPLVVDKDKERVWSHFSRAAEGEAQTYEARGMHKEGHIIHFNITNLPIYVGGEIVGVFGIAQDITEQKRMARKLKKSEQKWQHLVEENPQPVQVTVDGVIKFINEAGARVYGAESPGKMIGKSIFDYLHPDEEPRIRQRKEKLERGEKVDVLNENRIIRPDGEVKYVEVSSIPIEFNGETGIQTVVHDITDRKKKEQIIEESLHEKEVLLKEIHHRVKNNLAVVSGLLQLQSLNSDKPEIEEMYRESQMRIHSMAAIHEKLYESESLAAIDFNEYARELVDTIVATYGYGEKNIDLIYNLDTLSLSVNQAIPCALLLNEMVSNAFKHAFDGRTEGRIGVDFRERDSDILELIVRDDGSGLPDDFEIENQQSLGMTLIHTLSEQLYSDLSISNDPDWGGARFEVQFEKE